MQGPVRHWMESDILRQRARGFAADIDHDHTIHEIAGAEQLVQRLFLDVNHHRFLIVAINYGGQATLSATVPGGLHASPVRPPRRNSNAPATMTYSQHLSNTTRPPTK